MRIKFVEFEPVFHVGIEFQEVLGDRISYFDKTDLHCPNQFYLPMKFRHERFVLGEVRSRTFGHVRGQLSEYAACPFECE